MWTTHSALFPHRQRHAPRGFILPRFVNVDRHHPAATVAMRSTSKNLQECGHSRRLAPMTGLQDKADPTTNAAASSAAPCQNQVWQLNRQLPSPSTG